MNPLNELIKAIAFAAAKHRDQRRKDVCASPYINHPIQLVDVLTNEAGITDINVLEAAILHDTIEDTQTTSEELEQHFGQHICQIVLEVSDDGNLCRSDRKQAQISNAAELSDEARLVKLADKICNLRDVADNPPAGWDVQRRQEYFDWCLAVINGLRGVHQELERIFDEAYSKRPE